MKRDANGGNSQGHIIGLKLLGTRKRQDPVMKVIVVCSQRAILIHWFLIFILLQLRLPVELA